MRAEANQGLLKMERGWESADIRTLYTVYSTQCNTPHRDNHKGGSDCSILLFPPSFFLELPGRIIAWVGIDRVLVPDLSNSSRHKFDDIHYSQPTTAFNTFVAKTIDHVPIECALLHLPARLPFSTLSNQFIHLFVLRVFIAPSGKLGI